MIGIYKIENIKNGKKYIGSSVNIEKRFNRHISDLKNNKHINIILQRSFNKHDINDFIFECIEICEKENLREIEQGYLNNIFEGKEHNKCYYNIGKQSSGGDNLTNNPNKEKIINNIKNGLHNRYKNESEEDKKKRKENLIGDKNPNYDKRWNQEKRERMSNQRKGIPSKIKGKTYEELYGNVKANKLKNEISLRMKNQTGDKNPNYGKECPEHIKKYYSNLFKGKRNKNVLSKSKPFTINDKIYVLLKDAENDLNINYLTIRHRLISENKRFIDYKYIEDKEKINEILLDYKNKYFSE